MLSTFDRVYIINLPERRDRRDEMRAELAAIGVDMDDARVTLFAACRPADRGGFDAIGTHGTFMSHLGVLRDARQHGHARILVLEDDAHIGARRRAQWQTALRALARSDWQLFWGGWRSLTPLPALASPLHRLAPEHELVLAHCVGFTAPAIAALLPYLEAMLQRPTGDPRGGPMHVDGAYSWFRAAHPQLATWIAHPQVATQRASRTDVHALRWFDRAPGVRALVALARKAKNRLAA